MSTLPSFAVVAAVWAETGPLRDFHHHPGCCRVGPGVAAAMLRGADAPPGCSECYDVLVDALEHVRAAVGRAGEPDEPAAFARVLTRRHVVDRLRSANAELHGVSRPERGDGIPGRIRAELHRMPNGAWLDALLTLVLRAASARGPVPTQVWPLDTFAHARAAALGLPDDVRQRDRVRGEVGTVLRAIERVAGGKWLDDHVHAPLRARSARFDGLPIHDAPSDPGGDPARSALESGFWRRMSGDAVAAVRGSAVELSGRSAEEALLRRVAVALIADLPGLGPLADERAIRAAVADRCAEPRAGAGLEPRVLRAVRAELALIPTGQSAPSGRLAERRVS